MADDENTVSTSSSPLPLPSISTSNNIPIASTTASLFSPSSSDPSIPTPSQTSSPPLDSPQSTSRSSLSLPTKLFGLPTTAVIGAAAGVVLIIFLVGIWWCLRRRRQKRRVSKSDLPSDPPKRSSHLHNHDKNYEDDRKREDSRASIDSFPGTSPVQRPRDLESSLPSNNDHPRPSFSAARLPVPYIPPRSVSFPMPETTSYPGPEQTQEQQTNHIHIDMSDLDALMPIVISNEIKPVVLPAAQQVKVAQEDTSKTRTQSVAATTEAESRASSDTIMPTPAPRRPKLAVRQSSDSFIQGSRARISTCLPPPPPPPTIPPPAIPTSNSENSSYGQGRPSTESSSCRSSIYSTHPAGRRTRASTETPRVAYSRRSVSMDASTVGDGRRLSRRVILPPSTPPPPPTPLPPPPPVRAPTPSPTTSIPSTPTTSIPTPTPTSTLVQQPQQQQQPPPRRRHQRNPSQTLNTSLFDSSDRSAISPPLSPLTVQIPRPSSRSFQSLLTINTQLTAENVQQYLQQQQPATMEIPKPDSPTDSVVPLSPRTPSFNQPRPRRKSTSQLETHKIVIPPSAASVTSPTLSAFSPPVPPLPPMPAMPTLLADHLPSSPTPSPTPPPPSSSRSSNQSYMPLKRPSLSHEQSSASLNSTHTDNTAAASVNARIDIHHYHHHYHDNNDAGADDGQRLYQYHHYHDGRHSAEPKKHQQQKQQPRRSNSLPASPSSPPSQVELPDNNDSVPTASRTAAVAAAAASKDQELQAIIADAIAIAAAKTAAIELARQSAFHQQMQAKYQQHQQHQQQQRRLFPFQQQYSQMDNWRSATPSPNALDSSRPGSPL